MEKKTERELLLLFSHAHVPIWWCRGTRWDADTAEGWEGQKHRYSDWNKGPCKALGSAHPRGVGGWRAPLRHSGVLEGVPAPGEGQAEQLGQELVETQAGAGSAERGEPAEPGGEAGPGRGARGSSPAVGGQRGVQGRRGR